MTANRVLLLFVHGGLANGSVWREQLRLFKEAFACLAPDLPGHGARADETPGAPREIVDELAASFEGPCVVVGHSVGGLLALEMGRRHRERVRGIVTLESPVTPPVEYAIRNQATRMSLREPGAIGAWAARMVPEGSPYHGEITLMMQATPLSVAEWGIELAREYDSAAALRELRAPVLVVDRLVDEEQM